MTRKQKPVRNVSGRGSASTNEPASPPRIVGGTLGGRKLLYCARPEQTRPMKERTREAIFNLIGPAVSKLQAVDLFAGTGALGFEAISRGAARATLIEQHFPTAAVIRQNAAALGVSERVDVRAANTFIWALDPGLLESPPWLIFCSPPYAFFTDRRQQMLDLVQHLLERAPSESILVVEADRRFEMKQLPYPADWDVREYPPAVVALYRKP